jgi:hypothetical protein
LAQARAQCQTLTLYRRFEHAVILVLTGLIAVIIDANLIENILLGLIVAEQLPR